MACRCIPAAVLVYSLRHECRLLTVYIYLFYKILDLLYWMILFQNSMSSRGIEKNIFSKNYNSCCR